MAALLFVRLIMRRSFLPSAGQVYSNGCVAGQWKYVTMRDLSPNAAVFRGDTAILRMAELVGQD